MALTTVILYNYDDSTERILLVLLRGHPKWHFFTCLSFHIRSQHLAKISTNSTNVLGVKHLYWLKPNCRSIISTEEV